MMKLFKKNELLFAILCIVVYVIVCGNLRNMGDDSPYMAIGLIIISIILFLFVKMNGLMGYFGLDRWPSNSKEMLYFIPMWIVSTGNLWDGIYVNYKGLGILYSVISFVLIGFIEELLFRGFLFKALLKEGSTTRGIIISALTFGMGHIVNILTGHTGIETIIQMLFAVAIGFIYTFVYYKGESLIPVIISHAMIDTFSVFGCDNPVTDKIYVIASIIISIGYCYYLSRLKNPEVKN